MLRRPILVLVAALWASSCGWLHDEERFFLGGIQVNEPDHEHWISALEEAGMNTVAVTVYAHQGHWNTDHLWIDEDTEWVLNEIRAAKRRHMRVALILRVALDHTYDGNRFLWHGMIMPGSDEQLRSWFRRYARFVTDWARIAEAEGVDVLGIGSELNALASTLPISELPALERYYLDPDKQAEYKQDVLDFSQATGIVNPEAGNFPTLEDYLDAKVAAYEAWALGMTAEGSTNAVGQVNQRRTLLAECWQWTIDRVREVYGGQLTYAANFDQYMEVGFWPQLDVIGINAYFPLRSRFLDGGDRAQLGEELERGWRRVFEEIDAFRVSQELGQMPVLFTELGYTERRDATLAPWASGAFTVVWEHVSAEPTDTETAEPVDPARATETEAAPPAAAEKRLFVWSRQPIEPEERIAAVAALRRVTEGQFPEMLRGILYWKLSTLAEHREIEPFVAVLDPADEDRALIQELAAFREP